MTLKHTHGIRWQLNKEAFTIDFNLNLDCTFLKIIFEDVSIPDDFIDRAKAELSRYVSLREMMIDIRHKNEALIEEHKKFINGILKHLKKIEVLNMQYCDVMNFLEIEEVEIDRLVLPNPLFYASFGTCAPVVESMNDEDKKFRRDKIEEIRNRVVDFKKKDRDEETGDYLPDQVVTLNINAKVKEFKVPGFTLSIGRGCLHKKVVINFQYPIILHNEQDQVEYYQKSSYFVYSAGKLIDKPTDRAERALLWNKNYDAEPVETTIEMETDIDTNISLNDKIMNYSMQKGFFSTSIFGFFHNFRSK